MKINLIIFLIPVILCCCMSKAILEKKIIRPVLNTNHINEVQQEVDDIFMLLTYSLVYKDWQQDSIPRNKRRGYNIGSVIVNKNNEPVGYGLNCISSTNNATQHGEVRCIFNYIEQTKCFNLPGFSLYTSLEPCIMCAGMITMTSIKKVIYGQHDVEYSKAFERLAIDTRLIGGFEPYPRAIVAEASSNPFCKQLDNLYSEFLLRENEKILAKFLTSDPAEKLYRQASLTFLTYTVKHEANKKVLTSALLFYNQNSK